MQCLITHLLKMALGASRIVRGLPVALGYSTWKKRVTPTNITQSAFIAFGNRFVWDTTSSLLSVVSRCPYHTISLQARCQYNAMCSPLTTMCSPLTAMCSA